MRTTFESILNALWYDKRHAWLSVLLAPAQWLYAMLARRNWHAGAQARTQPLPVPVVVVGNIVAGGSGKTPVTQALASALTARGIKVGIVSRGYGGTIKQATPVDANQPQLYGDEPCLLAATTACPVVVAQDRSQGVRLLHRDFGVQLVISDDGMQHTSLHRDFEICVLGPRGVGNGKGLPAGPLREPLARLNTVNALLTWGKALTLTPAPAPAPTKPGKTVAQWVIHGAHSPLQLLSGNPAPEGNLQALAALQAKSLDSLQTKLDNAKPKANTPLRLLAAAGLAQPERFYVSLAGAGLQFKTLAVADHGMLTTTQLAGVKDGVLLLVTEKDAVKLRAAQLPAALQRRIRIVPWRVSVPTPLVDTIAALVKLPAP